MNEENDSESEKLEKKKKPKIKRVKKIYIINNSLQLINYFDNWKGNNFFLFKRRTITGPLSLKAIIASFSSIFFPVLIFIIFESKVNKNN